MSVLYDQLKRMMAVAESVGNITNVDMDHNWLGLKDRISIEGTAMGSGNKFELTLEVEREEKDA